MLLGDNALSNLLGQENWLESQALFSLKNQQEEGTVETVSSSSPAAHIMLSDLSSGLKAGQRFPLTVTFEKAGIVEIPVKVGKPAAMGPV